MVSTPAPPLRVLMASAIDYAGLFPPASLPMDHAVQEFVAARRGEHRWALGRFVVPAGQLSDLARAAEQAGGLAPGRLPPAGLSVLAGSDLPAAVRAVAESASALRGQGAEVEAIECRVGTPAEVAHVVGRCPAGLECWVEIPLADAPAPWLDALQRAGGLPKIRTGGIVAAAFPAPRQVIAFLVAARQRRLPFKATAGLHHAVRGEYALTYAAGSELGTMYGYLNLFLATALLEQGGAPTAAQELLLETHPAAFRVDADSITWRSHTFRLEVLQHLRRAALRAFGSCSFREPVAELLALDRS